MLILGVRCLGNLSTVVIFEQVRAREREGIIPSEVGVQCSWKRFGRRSGTNGLMSHLGVGKSADLFVRAIMVE